MDGWMDRSIDQTIVAHESFLEIECLLYSLSGTAVGAISLLYCEMSGQYVVVEKAAAARLACMMPIQRIHAKQQLSSFPMYVSKSIGSPRIG